ncbi:hypothetical protein G7074_18220 [Pedobacter sp. HDW13]|uniref:hypothetical protein n=1 Tax=Pedobacter sp. HDW13 TaxID=2714940 RepID=UPI001408DC0E|nr:hypothetical protein [Pedobacter sp. HDW13]QIL41030.1 hypothetical protein G7074_18220 [Pedobacter sp. HDW13]
MFEGTFKGKIDAVNTLNIDLTDSKFFMLAGTFYVKSSEAKLTLAEVFTTPLDRKYVNEDIYEDFGEYKTSDGKAVGSASGVTLPSTPNQQQNAAFINRLSERDEYLYLDGSKVKAGTADYSTDSGHANFSDYATNAGHAVNSDRAVLADLATNAIHANNADYAIEAGHASLADYAKDSDKWDNKQFDDYLDQPLRKTDAVKFASVVADTVNSTVYVSGFTGSGYRINPDGSAEFDSLTVRKELNINVLNVREITGSGGSVAITNVAKIKDVVEWDDYYQCNINTDDGTITVQLRIDDIVRCQVWDGKKLKYYSARVRAVSAGIFDLDKASFVGGGRPAPGDTVFQFGNATNADRQGLIYLTNSDTGAPYLDVLDGITSDNLAGKTKVRLGRLNGINDVDLGQLDGYGIYAERAFIKGKIVVTGGNAETVTGSQAKANTAQANAINTASGDASVKANNAQNNAISVASSDAQNKANAAQTAAAGYTDSKALATISAAQTYADNSATSKANAAQANAISQASTDAQNKANAAQANAALLSQQLVDGIKVGSRNLILNSNTPVENNAYSLNVYSLAMSAVVGETYTFSAKVNLSAGQTGIYLNVIDYVNYPSIAELVYPDADGIFRKTFVMPNGATSYNYIGLYTTPLGNYQTAKVFWVKLEKGNKATDWTPAPEDVQNAIDTANALANAANASYASLTANLKSLAYADVVELAKLGTTIIDGGKIKTTLLDADYIRANVINAGYINTLELDATAIKSGTIDSARINASQIISNGGGATTVQLNQAKQDAENAAKAYADAQDNLKKIEANAYADGKVSAEEQRAINDAIAKLNEAKADATAKDNAVKTYADNAKLEAITTATTQSAADATVKASQAQVIAIQTAATDATQKANNAIVAASNDATYKAEEAKRYAEAKSFMSGKMLNRDADFRDGISGMAVYNNLGNGNVIVDRLDRSYWGDAQNALPTTSSCGVRIKNIGSASPGLGGFYFGTQTRANAKFVTRLIANIPVGYTIHFHSNSTGDGGYGYWATPVVGTGTWQEYIYVLQCGSSGTFSSTNFFALDGNNYGMEWHLAYATVFDVTDSEVNYLKDAQAKADAAQIAATNLAYAQAAYEREVAKSYADGKITAEEAARIAQAATNLQVAKDDATNKVNAAYASANGYTDTKTQQTLVAAQTYADNSAQNKANIAQSNAISQASTDAQNKANAAQAAANLLSQQLVDGIKVGGRNLVLNSNTPVENNNYTLNVYSLAISGVAGETYTFSAKVNLSVGQVGLYLNVIDYVNYPSIAELIYPDADGIFRKTFVMPNGAAKYNEIGLYTSPLGNYQTAKAFWVKLEKGNKATDWTPAPEDVQNAIDTANALANAANASYASLTASLKSLAYQDVVELAKLGSTVIEGGKVKTTLLDADYIRANVINASYVQSLNVVATNIQATTGSIGGWNLGLDRLFSGSESSNYIALISGSSPELYMKNSDQVSGEYSSLNTKGLYVMSSGNSLPSSYGYTYAVGAFKLKSGSVANSAALYAGAPNDRLAFYCDGSMYVNRDASFNASIVISGNAYFNTGFIVMGNLPNANDMGIINNANSGGVRVVTAGVNAGRLYRA